MACIITVCGSLNVDCVIRTERVPAAGETFTATSYNQATGGKGLNQAVACARLGLPHNNTRMVGCIGNDHYARMLQKVMRSEEIDYQYVSISKDVPTGVATVIVEEGTGENRILHYPGANHEISRNDIHRAMFKNSAMLVLQLEIPMDVVECAINVASSMQVPILLNPAPAAHLPAGMFKKIDYLVANETEAAFLTQTEAGSLEGAYDAAKKFVEFGVKCAVITLGARGALWVCDDGDEGHVAAPKVKAVDSTGAGDTFVGGFALQIVAEQRVREAVLKGVAAASTTVQKRGGQESIPRAGDGDLDSLSAG